MNCNEVQELLSPYIDNMLKTEEMNLVSQHLATCRDCSEEHERLQALVHAFKYLEDEELPEGFNQRVMNRLKMSIRKKRLFPSSWLSVGAAAAVLLALFIGLTPGHLDEALMESRHPAGQTGLKAGGESETCKILDKVRENETVKAPMEAAGRVDTGKTLASADNKMKNTRVNSFETFTEEVDTSMESVSIPGKRIQETSSRGGLGKKQDDITLLRDTSLMSESATQTKAAVPAPGTSNDAADTLPAFIHINAYSLYPITEKLSDTAKSLGGDIVGNTVISTVEKDVVAKTHIYIAAIPYKKLPDFKERVSALGIVIDENLKVNASAIGSAKNIGFVLDIQRKKEYIAKILRNTSYAEEFSRTEGKVASTSQSKPETMKVIIIVEKKGN